LSPELCYYHDTDGTEIDLLFGQARTLHPVEIRKSGRANRDGLRAFAALDRLKVHVGEGGGVCATRFSRCPRSTAPFLPG